MTRDLVEHVIEESDAGGELPHAGAVEVEANANLRFSGIARHFRAAV
jgi:hypothetical protein